jgi:hypothetical protein
MWSSGEETIRLYSKGIKFNGFDLYVINKHHDTFSFFLSFFPKWKTTTKVKKHVLITMKENVYYPGSKLYFVHSHWILQKCFHPSIHPSCYIEQTLQSTHANFGLDWTETYFTRRHNLKSVYWGGGLFSISHFMWEISALFKAVKTSNHP